MTAPDEYLSAAPGFYDCPCGSAYEYTPESTPEEYAALNRWLGHHLNGCSGAAT